MNLLQAIHQRWAAAEALNALLPAARVYTGTSPDAAVPYAVIARTSQRPEARGNDGSSFDLVGLRIEVFHGQYDAAATIVAQIKAAFDRTAFALAGSDRVVAMERTGESDSQQPDGTWHVTIDFQCVVYLAG